MSVEGCVDELEAAAGAAAGATTAALPSVFPSRKPRIAPSSSPTTPIRTATAHVVYSLSPPPEEDVTGVGALAAGLALVALDLGERPARGAPFAAWLRLARAAKAQNAVLLLLAPRPTAGTAADVVVRALRARPVWNAEGSGQTPLLAGLDARLVVERHRGPAGAGGAVALPLRER